METAATTDALCNFIVSRIIPSINRQQQGFIDENNISSDDYLFNMPTVQKKALQDRFFNLTYRNCNRLLDAELKKILPNSSIWNKNSPRTDATDVWITALNTPLMGNCSVSVAWEHNNQLIMAQIWDSSSGKIYVAEKEYGASVIENDFSQRDLDLSKAPLSPNSNSMYILPDYDQVAGMEGSVYGKFMENYGERLEGFSSLLETRAQWYSDTGSISPLMMKVAENEAAFLYASAFCYTDAAAGIFMLELLNGRCTDFEGGKQKLLTGEELFCSNAEVHKAFLETRMRG